MRRRQQHRFDIELWKGVLTTNNLFTQELCVLVSDPGIWEGEPAELGKIPVSIAFYFPVTKTSLSLAYSYIRAPKTALIHPVKPRTTTFL